ncbi:putative ABC transport system ATP-binding protein [Bacilli bacterium PM5-3]|nr:putative ABC transport system ATP-binding protein [Bacilli bacterium PM5-3]MDH6603140.1 putative ABC transport system ATP-binding protein [Bacilli bacterium PM5-9]
MKYINIIDLKKTYFMGDIEINALNGVNIEIDKGELVIIVGASGAGKTTLLNLIGGMDSSTSGSLYIDGKDITTFNNKQLTKYRRDDVGFVFQFYNLIPNITALENVEMACEVATNPFDAKKIMSDVGLSDRLNNFPSQLSGGQQQRVSIARALAKNPKLLLCDEPTGALDYESGKAILKLLQEMAKTYNMSVVIITHNQAIEAIGDHIIKMKNGTISEQYYNDNPLSIDEVEW